MAAARVNVGSGLVAGCAPVEVPHQSLFSVTIDVAVAAVQQSKYVGPVLDDKLNLDANTVAIWEKGGSASVLYEEAAEIQCRKDSNSSVLI